jgi:glycosyltransferase involved in cell wall biosynthesis
MAKICMISVNHSPLDDRIFYKEAMTLKSVGHTITMICRADENGVMYDMGNKIPLNTEEQKEVSFNEIIAYPIASPTGTINTVLKKVFKGEFYNKFIEKAIEIDADVYHAHEPESFYIGLQIAKKNGAHIIFDSHESYTTGTPKEIWIKNQYLKDLKYLITANHITRGHLVSLHHTIQSTVIYNAAQPEFYTNHIQKNKPESIVIAHDGYLPFNRGLKEMLQAILKVYQKHTNIQFKIIGETFGEEKEFLNKFIQQHKMEGIISETGWVKYEDVASHLSDCKIGIIAKTPTINNIIGGPPIKYYNYTAAGMAIIDVDMPETTRLLSKYKNGVSVSNRTADGIASAIFKLIESPDLLQKYQHNSIAAFQDLNWDNEGKKLTDFYRDVVLNREDLTLH